MKKKNFNTRKCIINNKNYPKCEMLRFCLINNEIQIGNDQKRSRGYYINLNNNYEMKIIINKLKKTFKTNINEKLLNELRKIFINGKGEVNYG